MKNNKINLNKIAYYIIILITMFLKYILSEIVEFYYFVCKHNPTIIDFNEEVQSPLDESLL